MNQYAKKKFKEFKAPFIFLGNYNYQLDHMLKKLFRSAFGLDEKQSYVVVVSAFLNGLRINEKPLFNFFLFDFRVRSPWVENKMPSLFSLIKN